MGTKTVASTDARARAGVHHRAGTDPGPAPPGRHVRTPGLPGRAFAARAALAAVALPLIVALVALHQRRWYPVVDFAQFEMRLRDVGTGRTPLVGTVGRLYGYGQRGNHPGPLDFYLLAPVYRAAGASPWAMQLAMAAVDARQATPDNVKLSDRLAPLIGPTAAALDRGSVPGGGRDGRYRITWDDPVDLGMHGYGLLNELDRLGFTVGLGPAEAVSVTPHRTLAEGEFTGVIHLAVGDDIARWRSLPGAVEVVYVDHRTPVVRAEAERLQDAVAWELRAAGQDGAADHLTNVSYVTLDRSLPAAALRDLSRLVTIGLPTAVFVGPPDLAPG